jgi:hypothetical protein
MRTPAGRGVILGQNGFDAPTTRYAPIRHLSGPPGPDDPVPEGQNTAAFSCCHYAVEYM